MDRPLISFVIPTFERSNLLGKCLASLVHSILASGSPEIFEVFVSDNASTDSTLETVSAYVRSYPSIVKSYHHQELLPPAENLEFALSNASGVFLKPLNDKILVSSGAASAIRDLVFSLYERQLRGPIIFSNGHSSLQTGCKAVYTLDSLIETASYIITWWGSLGLWRSDLSSISLLTQGSSKWLSQVELLLALFYQKRIAIICDLPLFRVIPTKPKDYNVANVFGREYAEILYLCVESNRLSRRIYEAEVASVFRNHVLPGYFDFENQNNYIRDGFFEHLSYLTGIVDVEEETSAYIRHYLVSLRGTF